MDEIPESESEHHESKDITQFSPNNRSIDSLLNNEHRSSDIKSSKSKHFSFIPNPIQETLDPTFAPNNSFSNLDPYLKSTPKSERIKKPKISDFEDFQNPNSENKYFPNISLEYEKKNWELKEEIVLLTKKIILLQEENSEILKKSKMNGNKNQIEEKFLTDEIRKNEKIEEINEELRILCRRERNLNDKLEKIREAEKQLKFFFEEELTDLEKVYAELYELQVKKAYSLKKSESEIQVLSKKLEILIESERSNKGLDLIVIFLLVVIFFLVINFQNS